MREIFVRACIYLFGLGFFICLLPMGILIQLENEFKTRYPMQEYCDKMGKYYITFYSMEFNKLKKQEND